MQVTESCHQFLIFCFSNKVDLGSLVAVILFVAGLFANSWVEKNRRKSDISDAENKGAALRRKYLIALSEEIGLNIESIEKAIGDFPSRTDVSIFLRKSRRNRPLVVFSFYSILYKAETGVLEDLPDILIRSIVEFYGKLDAINADCKSVESPSFITISYDGRENIFLDIEMHLHVCLQYGKSIKSAITQHLRDTENRKGGT